MGRKVYFHKFPPQGRKFLKIYEIGCANFKYFHKFTCPSQLKSHILGYFGERNFHKFPSVDVRRPKSPKGPGRKFLKISRSDPRSEGIFSEIYENCLRQVPLVLGVLIKFSEIFPIGPAGFFTKIPR
jgi:hypothetical protein